MPLPASTTQWPPQPLRPHYRQFAEHGAWYSGDPVLLAGSYAAPALDKTKVVNADRQAARFWSRRARDTGWQKRGTLHVPLPADIAATSADLLFGEPPMLIGPPANQDDIDAMSNEMQNLWLEAAELASAFGGVYLRPAWDQEVDPDPFLTVVRPDAAWPKWRHGRLTEVVFWTTLGVAKGGMYRHLERHSLDGAGRTWLIEHALYVGDKDVLGSRISLAGHPETADLDDEVQTGVPWLGVEYVPNMRPNRRWRSPDGRSDFSSSEGVFDALDETWNSWMRDLRLGAGRLVVPEQYLDFAGTGKGQAFDVDRELFSPINVPTGMTEGADITLVQFEIRFEAHASTALALIERAVSSAGYSPQDFGLQIEGRAESGTALRQRRQRSLHTTGRKQRYWNPAVTGSTRTLLQLQRTIFSSGPGAANTDWTLDVKWQEPLDLQELASTAQMLRTAQAASTELLVRLTNPNMDDDLVQQEVARIQGEQGMAVADPFADLP